MSFEERCQALAGWVEGVIGEPLEFPGELFKSLKNGAILCQLMSEVNHSSCPDFDPFPETEEAERQNVDLYLAACGDIGVTAFAPEDLSGAGDVRRVVANLIEFAEAAKAAGLAALELPQEAPAAPVAAAAASEVVRETAPARPAPAAAAKAPPRGALPPPARKSERPQSPHDRPAKKPEAPAAATATAVAAEEPEDEAGGTRARGDTASLLEWQPPTTSNDDALRLENTRLKAQAERANMTATTQTKLKDDALSKLAKEKDKVRELEAELDAERRKHSTAAAADSSLSAVAVERDALRKQVADLKKQLGEAEERGKQAQERADAATRNAATAEKTVEDLRTEMRHLEDDALYLTGELNKVKEAAEQSKAVEGEVATLKEQLAKSERDRKGLEEEMAALKSLQALQRPAPVAAAAPVPAPAAPTPTVVPAVPAPAAVPETDASRPEDDALTRSAPKTESPRSAGSPRAQASPRGPALKAPGAPAPAPTAGTDEVTESECLALLEGRPCKLSAARFSGNEKSRKVFAAAVKRAVKKSSDGVDMVDRGFATLTEVLRAVLSKLDPGSPDDFALAKKVLRLGAQVRCKGKLLREAVCDLPVWTEPVFWDDLLAARIARAFERTQVDEDDQSAALVRKTLEEVGRLMLDWRVAEGVVLEVITQGAENEGLTAADADDVLADLISGVAGSGGGDGKRRSPAPMEATMDEALADEVAPEPEPEEEHYKAGSLKFKKASKWLKAAFTLSGNVLTYDYAEEGGGDYSDQLVLTAAHEATAGSDQAPGALRNYSFKISCDNAVVLHLLASKQPEVTDWLVAINGCPSRRGLAAPAATVSPVVSPRLTPKEVPAPRGVVSGKAPGVATVPAAATGAPASRMVKSASSNASRPAVSATPLSASQPAAPEDRKGSLVQPPVRINRTETQSLRLVKEGDVKMHLAKRWLKAHLEIYTTGVVLTYIDPTNNTDQVRIELPLQKVLIAPLSPLAPAALKEQSWRLKEFDTEYHIMCASKTEAKNWLDVVKKTRDANK